MAKGSKVGFLPNVYYWHSLKEEIYYSLAVAILLATAVLLANTTILLQHRPVYADCVKDNDWPEKPCLDTPPYPESFLKETWQKYHEYKGKEWMEMKKAEMDQTIIDGTLKEWLEYQSEPNNFANFNVYYYYFVNGQAPDVDGYSGAITWDTSIPMRDAYDPTAFLRLIVILGVVIGGAVVGIFYYFKRVNERLATDGKG